MSVRTLTDFQSEGDLPRGYGFGLDTRRFEVPFRRFMSAMLVTGGCGFVGSHIAKAAFDAGHRVVILDDHSARAIPSLPGVEIVWGDIADQALVARLLEEHSVNAVVHCAGKICVADSVTDPAGYYESNVVKTLALLDALRGHDIRFVFSSSAAVYGAHGATIDESTLCAPVSPYGETKLVIERVLAAYGRAYGLRWSALRYFNASGAHTSGALRESHRPETHLIPLAIDAALGRGEPLIIYGDDHPTEGGTCVRDYVHVMDLADAHLKALETAEVGCTNLGSGFGVSVREVLDVVQYVLRKPVPYSVGARREGDPATLVANVDRAMAVLEWWPARSEIEVVIEDAVRSRY